VHHDTSVASRSPPRYCGFHLGFALGAALDASREASSLAEAAGLGYPLALARAALLWQQEVLAPGHPEHAPRIEAALGEARDLGLRGPAVSLTWVRLLHLVTAAGLPDRVIEGELGAALRTASPRPPVKGTWELLALDAVRMLRERRPSCDRTALEALLSEVVATKERSLDPEDRPIFRATRRGWGDRTGTTASLGSGLRPGLEGR
jgi:hypothetical protein